MLNVKMITMKTTTVKCAYFFVIYRSVALP